jgi:L-asparaginase
VGERLVKHVLVLATGDTPAHVRDPDRPRVATGAELLETIPAERLPARVTVEDVMAEPSGDTSAATMLALGRRARSALLVDGFDGVVITHGPDAVEETAFLVDLMGG